MSGKFAQGLVGAEGAWGRFEFDPLGFSTSLASLLIAHVETLETNAQSGRIRSGDCVLSDFMKLWSQLAHVALHWSEVTYSVQVRCSYQGAVLHLGKDRPVIASQSPFLAK